MKKIVEEAQDLSEAESISNITEEIADVYEIVDALITLKKLSKSEINSVQCEKRQKRGGFEDRLIMLENPSSSDSANSRRISSISTSGSLSKVLIKNDLPGHIEPKARMSVSFVF